jgi:hypothetical protein
MDRPPVIVQPMDGVAFRAPVGRHLAPGLPPAISGRQETDGLL